MRLSSRIALGYLALVALMTVLAVHQLSLVQRLHGENRRLAGVDLEASRAALRLRAHRDTLSRLSRIFFVRRDAAYADELAVVRGRVDSELESLRGLPLSADERDALDDLAARWERYEELATDTEERVLGGGAVERRALLSALESVSSALGGLEEASRTAARTRVEDSAAAASRARTAAWGVTAVALAAGLLLALAVAASVARPLRRLARGTRELARGDFAHRVPPTGGPELAALARDFNSMADRLGELDRLKRDFVSAVSHDLKAPLASMQETTRLLLDGTPGTLDDDQRRLLRLNLESGERLGEMIADLLEVARLEAGALELDLEREDLAALAHRAADEVCGLAAARRVEIDLSTPDLPVPVDADAALLVRAVWNLLSNAVKFSPAGARIELEVRTFGAPPDLARAYRRPPELGAAAAGGWAALEVRDHGPGIPDADKERVFDRFHRVDPDHRGVQGTGLGLAIARGVAEGHGGHLWVEDGEDGSGSRFVLLLPRRPAAERRSGEGKRLAAVLLTAALLAASLAAGCASAPPRASSGDRLLAADRPAAAAEGWERQLAAAGDAAPGSDVALLHLALLHLAPDSPLHNPAYGDALLRRLVAAHPDGAAAAQARWLLELRRENRRRQEEIERLRRQLEELRRIDLETP